MRTIFTRFLLISFVFGGFLFDLSSLQAQDFDWTETNVEVAESYIVPRYQKLATSAESLHTSLVSECENISTEESTISPKIKELYTQLLMDWLAVQHIKFGPVEFLFRYERFHFWQDKRGPKESQFRTLLNELRADQAVDWTRKSVSVQGLVALERLLYTNLGFQTGELCELMIGITENLNQIAQQVDSSWRLPPVRFSEEFALAAKEQGSYGSSFEVTTVLANSLTEQLVMIAEYKIAKALPKEEGGRAFLSQLEAPYSGLSLTLIESSLLSLQSFYELLLMTRAKDVNRSLNDRITNQFSALIKQSRNMPDRLSVMITNEEQLPLVVQFMDDIMALYQLIGVELFPVLGISSLFNANDGD